MDASRRLGVLAIGVMAGLGAGWGLATMPRPRPVEVASAGPSAEEQRLALGRELFHREWTPGDPRSRGGDGLGPVYNESSCVACHNLGGPGGGGPANRNVDIVTGAASSGRRPRAADPKKSGSLFDKAPSVVLHRFGVEPDFAPWRAELLGANQGPMRRRGNARVEAPIELARAELAVARLDSAATSFATDFVRSQRNAPALFGAGPIDAIPEATIMAAAARRFPEFPQVTGRVGRVEGGRLGRFGWKGQVATLNDFVRTACSVELGLEVPGHPQSADPLDQDHPAPGLDLDGDDCDALADYVRTFPPPAEGFADAEVVRAGREAFASVGCATCHMPDLGPARGIYSDLSLHDMGREMSDSAAYYGIPSGPAVGGSTVADGASATEWRTPPLWGVRDSAPYLHDGRAETLEQAIAFHDGEAKAIADRFFGLPPAKRRQVLTFLNTLGAPREPKAATP